MKTTTETVKPSFWDFSDALALANVLAADSAPRAPPSQQDVRASERPHQKEVGDIFYNGGKNGETASLGDFSTVWQFLGTPQKTVGFSFGDEPAPRIAPSKDDYASDGAAYRHDHNTPSKTRPTPYETDGDETCASASDATVLTKNQRKKQRRKERKATERAQQNQKGFVSESEADIAVARNPALKASTHIVQHTSPGYNDLKTVKNTVNAIIQQNEDNGIAALKAAQNTIHEIVAANKLAKLSAATAPSALQSEKSMPVTTPARNSGGRPGGSGKGHAHAPASGSDALNGYSSSPPSGSLKHPSPATPKPQTNPASQDISFKNIPTGPSAMSLGVRFLPSSVPPKMNGRTHTSDNIKNLDAVTSTPLSLASKKDSSNSQPAIRPIVVRSGEDRNWAFLLKIINNHWEDRKYLVSPMNLTTHNNDPKGIHVFVDASNIFLGFKDQLKYSRGIHPLAHVPDVEMSFDALALLIERRRPVAKRVLAGSTPHLSVFDKAKAVGYECSILEKVYKARELTERQIYFKEADARRNWKGRKVAPPSNSVNLFDQGGTGNGSGTETATPQYAPAKMIEQGVDEVLHLKILESVVDTDEPSTIVLATGDAAAAEYSGGFMVMAQRALKKGWRVELVSWSKNISTMYTRRQWMDMWGDRFRIIYLDDYAEDLLDM